jgi:hypothetical protein
MQISNQHMHSGEHQLQLMARANHVGSPGRYREGGSKGATYGGSLRSNAHDADARLSQSTAANTKAIDGSC